ncbi:MAG: hypothetical protein EBZ49_00420 [Proteobacteria bacterium]|nr:hypothetical protein [Pseudomonadota bacterium]
MDNQLRKLAAEKMLQLHKTNKEHEKRAHALRLIYKQAELGFGEVPRSYRELQEKVASLLNQDLNVVEKALELTGGNMKLGELAQQDFSVSADATEQFQAAIIGEL